MANKLNTHSQNANFNFSLCRFKLLVEKLEHQSTNQNSIKAPKVFEPKNKITWLYYFGCECNLQSNVPSLTPWNRIIFFKPTYLVTIQCYIILVDRGRHSTIQIDINLFFVCVCFTPPPPLYINRVSLVVRRNNNRFSGRESTLGCLLH